MGKRKCSLDEIAKLMGELSMADVRAATQEEQMRFAGIARGIVDTIEREIRYSPLSEIGSR